MSIEERVKRCRLIEQMDSTPTLSERLGLENKSTFHGKVIGREKDKDVKR
mgnify:FL=1